MRFRIPAWRLNWIKAEPSFASNSIGKRETLVDGLQSYDPRVIHRLRGVTLKSTEDSFEDAQPEDCAVEQVVTYRDLTNLDQILVNQDLVDAMDNINQAALYLHEGLYKYLRSNQGETEFDSYASSDRRCDEWSDVHFDLRPSDEATFSM